MGIPVELRDDKGNLKDSTKTDEKSNYVFKDLAPGTYRITAVRTGTATKARHDGGGEGRRKENRRGREAVPLSAATSSLARRASKEFTLLGR